MACTICSYLYNKLHNNINKFFFLQFIPLISFLIFFFLFFHSYLLVFFFSQINQDGLTLLLESMIYTLGSPKMDGHKWRCHMWGAGFIKRVGSVSHPNPYAKEVRNCYWSLSEGGLTVEPTWEQLQGFRGIYHGALFTT